MDICTVMITGIVNRCELKQIGDKKLCKLGVKVVTGFGDRATKTYFNVDIWGKSGEVAADKLGDGAGVSIVGELTVREYEGKNGPAKSMDVRASSWRKAVTFDTASKPSDMQPTDDIPF